jgi:hypothetical protein
MMGVLFVVGLVLLPLVRSRSSFMSR